MSNARPFIQPGLLMAAVLLSACGPDTVEPASVETASQPASRIPMTTVSWAVRIACI